MINALTQAGALIHADGDPVRSQTAPFVVNKDPEELLDNLVDFYLQTLQQTGVTLDDGLSLSWLLYADDAHEAAITERIAALATAALSETSGPVEAEE